METSEHSHAQSRAEGEGEGAERVVKEWLADQARYVFIKALETGTVTDGWIAVVDFLDLGAKLAEAESQRDEANASVRRTQLLAEASLVKLNAVISALWNMAGSPPGELNGLVLVERLCSRVTEAESHATSAEAKLLESANLLNARGNTIMRLERELGEAEAKVAAWTPIVEQVILWRYFDEQKNDEAHPPELCDCLDGLADRVDALAPALRPESEERGWPNAGD